MANFWERQTRRAGNAFKDYGGWALDPAGKALGYDSVGHTVGMLKDFAGGPEKAEQAQKSATNELVQGGNQALEVSQKGTKQAQDFLSPYNNAEDYQDLRSLVKGGSFQPKTSGFSPDRYQSMGQFRTGQYQAPNDYRPGQYQAPQGFDPGQFQGSNATTDNLGKYGLKGFDPSMPTQPQRQAATAENVNLFADPGYQFRLDQGMDALQNRLAGRGLIGSGAEQKAILREAQGLASQEFGNAYNRFQDSQNMAQGDFRDSRDFAASQLNDSYSRFSGDRAFGRGSFESDRAYGRGAYEDDRNFGRGAFTQDRAYGEDAFRDRRNFGRGAYENDRNFGFDQFRDARNFGRDVYSQDRDFGRGAYENDRNFDYGAQQDQYSRLSDLVGISRGAAGGMSDLAYRGGQDQAGIYTDIANARAAGTLGQYDARRRANMDTVGIGGRILGSFMGGT